jgi:hypothetical protein
MKKTILIGIVLALLAGALMAAALPPAQYPLFFAATNWPGYSSGSLQIGDKLQCEVTKQLYPPEQGVVLGCREKVKPHKIKVIEKDWD